MVTRVLMRRGAVLVALVLGGTIAAVPVAGPVSADPAPAGLDHFQCYTADPTHSTAFKPPKVMLTDEFGTIQVQPAKKANLLCNPVQKTRSDTGEVTPVANPDAHLVCFKVA